MACRSRRIPRSTARNPALPLDRQTHLQYSTYGSSLRTSRPRRHGTVFSHGPIALIAASLPKLARSCGETFKSLTKLMGAVAEMGVRRAQLPEKLDAGIEA